MNTPSSTCTMYRSDLYAVSEERPVVRGRILHGISTNRNRFRCSTTSASISGYSSGKLRLKTSSARRFTPTNPEVGSCTGRPRMGRSTIRKNWMPRPRTALVASPLSSTKREPITISQPVLQRLEHPRDVARHRAGRRRPRGSHSRSPAHRPAYSLPEHSRPAPGGAAAAAPRRPPARASATVASIELSSITSTGVPGTCVWMDSHHLARWRPLHSTRAR